MSSLWLWALLGCSDACGPVDVRSSGDIDAIERCRVVDGDLVADTPGLSELSLPNLEEVTGRLEVRGFANVSMPALRAVGTGVGRGDVTVAGVRDMVDLSALETVGLGAYTGEDPANTALRQLTLAGENAVARLDALTEIPRLTLTSIDLPAGLPAATAVDALVVRDLPSAALPAGPTPRFLSITSSDLLTTVDFPGRPLESLAPGAFAREHGLTLIDNAALTRVTAGVAPAVRIDGNPTLAEVTLTDVAYDRLDAEGNPAWTSLSIPNAAGFELWLWDVESLVIDAPNATCIVYPLAPKEVPPPCP